MYGRTLECAIVGVAESDLGVVPGRTAVDLAVQATLAAAADAGIAVNEIDGVFTCNLSRFAPVQLSEHLGLQPKVIDGTLVGGASFEMHLAHACAAISVGNCEVALVAYGSVQRSKRARKLEGFVESGTSAAQYENMYAPLYPLSFYAMVAQRYMHEHGATPEHLANVAVVARKWASLNPKAFKREPLTVAEVLASPMVSSPLHALDCCLVTDGGGAVIITSSARAKHLRKTPVRILGTAETSTHDAMSQAPDLLVHGSRDTGQRALAMAGLKPADIDLVQIYDAFTINVLVGLENLGFLPTGRAANFVAEGGTAPGGSLPVNTSGGGLSYCHPGMFGIFLLIEAVRQLRSECGERQIKGAEVALCHATGGIFSAHSTVILGV
jgi:acetyl-CoA acetyltransferase